MENIYLNTDDVQLLTESLGFALEMWQKAIKGSCGDADFRNYAGYRIRDINEMIERLNAIK